LAQRLYCRRMPEARLQKRTKIVATLGPASSDEATLRQMILAGMDCVRINFSHAVHEEVVELLARVRGLAEELDVPIAILGDLRGPRLRVGEIKGGSVQLKTGGSIRLTQDQAPGDAKRVPYTASEVAGSVKRGTRILVDDGDIELEVRKVMAGGDLDCTILRGAVLSSRRGINLPGIRVNLPALSSKDFADVDFAIEHEFDFLALSFVQSVDDVRLIDAYLAAKGRRIPVIAKIEKRSALEDIDAIVEAADGVMVARGDLALEMSICSVPIAQKRIINACRKASTPVITATQMLESMITNHKPTRAEATDVANAVFDGTDALMLSGETAIGANPVEVIATMASIAERAERAWLDGELPGPSSIDPGSGIEENIANAAQELARAISGKVIATFTASGGTARRVSCHRGTVPIVAFSPDASIRRRLALSWGVESLPWTCLESTDEMVELAIHCARERGLAGDGDNIIIIGCTELLAEGGQPNTLRVEQLPPQFDD
jgi:pyruvate kinase